MSTKYQPQQTATHTRLAETRAVFALKGGEGLNLPQILTLITGRDSAALWQHFGSITAIIRAADVELATFLPPVTRQRLKAALELAKRIAFEIVPDKEQRITSPDDAAIIFMAEMRHLQQEELHVLLLNSNMGIVGKEMIYRGNVNTSIARIAEIFRPAIRENAPNIIIAHNHPSGGLEPSPSDVHITRKIIEAGELLDIKVLDHLIIGSNGYTSMKARNLGEWL